MAQFSSLDDKFTLQEPEHYVQNQPMQNVYFCNVYQAIPLPIYNYVQSNQPQMIRAMSYPPMTLPRQQVTHCNNNINQVQLINVNYAMPPIPPSPPSPSPPKSVDLPVQSTDLPHIRNIGDAKLFTISEERSFDPRSTPFIPQSPSPTPSFSSSPLLSTHHAAFVGEYLPEFAARAELNIFIHPTVTNIVSNASLFAEDFSSPKEFYYYLNISTALQINDHQMNIFSIDNQQRVMFAHYDLHQQGSRGQVLYGVVVPNTDHSQTYKNNKWLWKLVGFQTSTEIYQNYGVSHNLLPVSSRKTSSFQTKLSTQLKLAQNIHPNAVRNANWSNVHLIKLRTKRSKKEKNKVVKFELGKQEWIQICLKSWNHYPCIPIIVDGNKNGINAHWIEFVMLIDISHIIYDGGFIGVSCRYKRNDGWMISSICMDGGDVLNKHRLVGLRKSDSAHYEKYLACFNTKYTEIQWSKPRRGSI